MVFRVTKKILTLELEEKQTFVYMELMKEHYWQMLKKYFFHRRLDFMHKLLILIKTGHYWFQVIYANSKRCSVLVVLLLVILLY